jgi:dihydrofolate reductase
MALHYAALASLDGCVADAEGRFDFAAPDDEVHAAVNDLQRGATGYLLGRRMYEVLQVWENDPDLAAHSPIAADYATIWQSADKHVFSTTLHEPMTRRTEIHPAFDVDAVRSLVADGDYWIGGPTVAAHAWRADLISEAHLFLIPVTVGGGLAALPEGLRFLHLAGVRRFGNGTVHLHYAV